MFERFTDGARASVVEANDHAARLGHGWIGCEHILLSVISADHPVSEVFRSRGLTVDAVEPGIRHPRLYGLFAGVDSEALASIGIDLDRVRESVAAAFGPDAMPVDSWADSRGGPRRLRRRRRQTRADSRRPFTWRAKKCLELSLREALALRDRHIGLEHIALALTHTDGGAVPIVLANAKVSAASLRADVLTVYRRAG
jgi:hypothetical protein